MREHFSSTWSGVLSVLLLAACGCGFDTDTSSDSSLPRGLRGAADGWNVVLISIDTLRADRLNSWGYRGATTSPAIDGLAASGARFARAQSPRALTWPSLATVLTGLYPSGHGLVANGYRFADGQAMLPILLGEQGYQTGAFLSNMCQAHHQGWSELDCAGGVDKRVVRRALTWLDSIDQDRPFLLWTHFFGAHPPYYNGGETAQKTLDPDYRGALAPKKHALDRVMREGIELDAADLQHLDAIYDAAVIGTDRYVGELLTGLEERIDLERTVIVLLADHGEDLYQHNRYLYHACSVYQSSLHVPLVIVAPGLAPTGAVVGQTVELTDVLPTLLDLLAIEAPACLHGASLAPYLERSERAGAGKPALSEYGDTRIRTFLDGHWKLVSNPDAITPICFPDGPEDLYPIGDLELYDLSQDPFESNNLASQEVERTLRLSERMEKRYDSLCGINESRRQEVPEDLRKQLEALGYVAD